MHMRILGTSLLLVLLVATVAMSQTPVRESFHYSFTTLAGLGTAANGFGGPWVADPTDNGIEGLVTVGGTRFSYADLNWTLPYDTTHLQVVKSNAWSDHQRYKRPLAVAWPNVAGRKYWVSYMLDVKDTVLGNTYFMVKLYDGTNERVAIGKGGGRDANPPVFTCGSGWPGSAGDDVSAVQIVPGPVWIVVRVDMTGGPAPHRTFMWIDPNPAGGPPDTATAAVKRNSDFSNGFDTIALEFGGDGPNVRLVFDEVRLDTSFANLSSSTLQGTYAARESFPYSHTTIAGLGATTNGFGGPWVVDPGDNGIGGLVAVGGTRFSYADLSWTLPYDTTHLQVVKSGAWSDHQRFKRPLAAPWPNVAGQKYWVSYLLDVKEPLPVGNTYFMVKLYDGTNERIAIGKGGGRDANPPVFTCGSGWPGSSGDDVSAVQITAGPVWLVVRIDMTGGAAPQRTFMWIDPNPAGGAPDTATAAVKRNSDFSNGFDTIALEFGGDGPNVRLVFDEIRIATTFAGLTTGVPSTGVQVPAQFALSQNYPNPFNPTTKINYTLDKAGQVRLAVYDLLGREVAVLVDGMQSVGNHEVTFGNDRLTSGVYFYRLQSAQLSTTKKMVLMK